MREHLLRFIKDQLNLSGIYSIVLGGRELGIPDIIFNYRGMGCALWLGLGELSPEVREKMVLMGKDCLVGRITTETDFLVYLERMKHTHHEYITGALDESLARMSRSVKSD